MIHHHRTNRGRRLDYFKLVVIILLLLLLIVQVNLRSGPTQPVSTLISKSEGITEATAELENVAEIEFTIPIPASLTTGAEHNDGKLRLTSISEPETEVQNIIDGQTANLTQEDRDDARPLNTTLTEPDEYESGLYALDASDPMVAKAEAASLSPATSVRKRVAPRIIFPADGADVLTGKLTLIGDGQPRSEVEIRDGQLLVDIAPVNKDGEWHFTLAPDEGIHHFTIRAVGNEIASSQVVTVMVVSPSDTYDCSSNLGFDQGGAYIVGTCDTLCSISQRLEVNCEALIAANPQIGNPDLIFPGQILNIP